MKKGLFLFLFFMMLISISGHAQALRDINYSYEYDTESNFSFKIKPVKQAKGWTVFYTLQLLDTLYKVNDFVIEWGKRGDLGDKEGLSLIPVITILNSTSTNVTGRLDFESFQSTQLLVAKVLNKTSNKLWLYYKTLQPNYTVTGYLQSKDGQLIFEPYINTNQTVSINGFSSGQSLSVSYYNDNFPTAAPAFSEGQARVSRAIKPDSSFFITNEQPVSFTQAGLYLVQSDTSSVEGVSFRVEVGYPKFRRLEDLVGPFVYVCTKEEFHNLRIAGDDKNRFDKGVIAITQNVSRAKEFMKNYFDRAEAANYYFTSYKEGWKTDRGMIYLIYGPPKTVFKFSDRETWLYGKTEFSFIKSSTLFDPENFVLIRNKKFADEWYEKVDLLRNSRF